MYAYFILDGERLGNQALETTEGKEVQTFHPDFPRVISLFAPTGLNNVCACAKIKSNFRANVRERDVWFFHVQF